MKLYEQPKDFHGNRTFKGKKKNYKVTVCFKAVSLKEEDPYY